MGSSKDCARARHRCHGSHFDVLGATGRFGRFVKMRLTQRCAVRECDTVRILEPNHRAQAQIAQRSGFVRARPQPLSGCYCEVTSVRLWAVAQIVTARAPKQCYQLLYVYPRDGVRGYLHVAPFVSRLHIHTSSLSANPISAQRSETLEAVMGAALSLHSSGSSESGSTPIQSSTRPPSPHSRSGHG